MKHWAEKNNNICLQIKADSAPSAETRTVGVHDLLVNLNSIVYVHLSTF
jgi:hypothetical protein